MIHLESWRCCSNVRTSSLLSVRHCGAFGRLQRLVQTVTQEPAVLGWILQGLFVSILIGYILLTKSLLCNVTAFTGMPYILESSDIQSLFLWCGKSLIMTSCKRPKLYEGYFSVQGRFCTDSNSKKSDPKQPSRRCGIPVWTLIS
jgi:hypothetical protein